MDSLTISEIISNMATVVALVLGGAWTYLLFIRQRIGLPRLQTTIHPDVFDTNSVRLVRAEVSLENFGSVMVTLKQAELRLRQVVPLPAQVADAAAEGYDPVPTGQQQISWPMLAGREWSWESGYLEIEPGESEALHAEFFVPEETEVVEFYFFVANAKKRRKALGWAKSQLWRVPGKVEATVAEVKLVEKSASMVHPDERQEKQQVAQQPQQQVQAKRSLQQHVQAAKGTDPKKS